MTGRKKKTNERFLQELKSVQNTIIPLELYKKAGVPILCRCVDCNHIWSARPDNLLRNGGCPSCAKYGFDSSKLAIFYILKISGNQAFTGFGISNVYKKRRRQHNNNLKRNNCSILSEVLIYSDGLTIQKLERYIKETLQTNNSNITGFKTESVLISHEELKVFCEKWLTLNCKNYSILVKH